MSLVAESDRDADFVYRLKEDGQEQCLACAVAECESPTCSLMARTPFRRQLGGGRRRPPDTIRHLHVRGVRTIVLLAGCAGRRDTVRAVEKQRDHAGAAGAGLQHSLLPVFGRTTEVVTLRDILLNRLKQDSGRSVYGRRSPDRAPLGRVSDGHIVAARRPAWGRKKTNISASPVRGKAKQTAASEDEEVSLAGLAASVFRRGVFRRARGRKVDQYTGRDGLASQPMNLLPLPRLAPHHHRRARTTTAVPEVGPNGNAHAHDIAVDGVTLEDRPRFIDLEPLGAPPGVKLHLRTASWSRRHARHRHPAEPGRA